MHCRDTQIVPLVDRPTLVSYISLPSITVRSKQSLWAPKVIISLCIILFETPCIIPSFQKPELQLCTEVHYYFVLLKLFKLVSFISA